MNSMTLLALAECRTACRGEPDPAKRVRLAMVRVRHTGLSPVRDEMTCIMVACQAAAQEGDQDGADLIIRSAELAAHVGSLLRTGCDSPATGSSAKISEIRQSGLRLLPIVGIWVETEVGNA